MELSKLINGIVILDGSCKLTGLKATSVCDDSRKCTNDSLFVAVNGTGVNGHNFINSAIDNGAKIIMCEYIPQDANKNANYIITDNTRKALAQIASNYYNNPSSQLKLVGVTGTNGKTSIATLLYNIFTSLGYNCGLLSTIANFVGDKRYETQNTTPGSLDMNQLMNQMVNSGGEYCFMEVSSNSVDQDRIHALTFAGGIFTNLTHDHLDYHGTFANYLSCKKKFFDNLPKDAFALTNIDDKNGKIMVQNTKAQVYTYSNKKPSDFKVKIIEKSIEGMLLNINGIEMWCRFLGTYNALNLTAVYGATVLLGTDKDEAACELSKLKSVAGRLEYIRGGEDIIAAVDYAHTPDALENVLKTLQELAPEGDLVCVFGCGGNRDKTKRPEMGEIAGKYATRVIVTSDNPRNEDPQEIINDIKQGMDIKMRAKSLFIPCRIEAIRTSILTSKPGSIILVAGKGHEDYQIINGVKHHLDDKEIISETFELLNNANN